MKARKVWAVLLSLTMLISLMPMGSLVLTGSAATETDTSAIVTEVSFGAASSIWELGLYNTNSLVVGGDNNGQKISEARATELAAATNMVYTVSFDYYLAAGAGVTMQNTGKLYNADGTDGGLASGTALATLQSQSIQHFSVTLMSKNATNNQFMPKLVSDGAVTLYMWNLKVEAFGEEISVFQDRSSSSTATLVADTHPVSYYPWAPVEEEPTVDTTAAVTEFTFTAADQKACIGGTYHQYSSGMDDTYRSEVAVAGENRTPMMTFRISFDYYLENDVEVVLQSYGGYNNGVTFTLSQGLHTFSGVITSTHSTHYQINPQFLATAAANLFVWNFAVAYVSPSAGDVALQPYSTNVLENATQNTATRTTGKTLADYIWAPDEYGNVKAYSVYVDSTNGDDTYDGLTAETAFKSPATAFAAIEASGYLRGELNIVGTYTATSYYDFSSDGTSATRWTTEYTVPVTIQGAASGAILDYSALNQLWLFGPTTFKNITIKTRTDSNGTIVASKQNVTFGEGVTLNTGWTAAAHYRPNIISGDYGRGNTADKTPGDTTIVNGDGTLWNVQLGISCANSAYISTGNNIHGGVTYIQNGGSVASITVGGTGNNAVWNNAGTSYLGDVNIVINGGEIASAEGYGGIYIQDDSYVSGPNNNGKYNPSNLNGHAVQILLNNGTKVNSTGNVPTAADAETLGGVLYMLESDATAGSSLSVTDTAGKYIVNGDKMAIATAEDGTKYYSDAGILTVPAGIYDVTYKASVYTGSIFVDYVNGDDDTNFGTSASDAFKTVAKALESATVSNPTITVVNKAVYDAAALTASDETVTFIGADNTAVLTYGGADMALKSNVNLQNLVLSQDVNDGRILTGGYNLQIGAGVTFTRGAYAGLDNPVIVTGAAADEREVLVLVGTGSAGLTIGADAANNTRVLVDGVAVDTLAVNSTNAAAKITAIVDGGQVKAVSIADNAAYAALQVLVKNGGSLAGAVAKDNTWYIVSEDDAVVLTDTPGTFNITVPADKNAVFINNDGGESYVKGGVSNDGTASKTASDETPVVNAVNTKFADWGCFTQNSAYLTNTYNKLTQDKALNVVYFGGSLTAGYGVGVTGDPNMDDGVKADTHSWRGLSGQWFKENFPEADINLINCAIGESGTFLGTYRVQDDVIAQNPDLLFLEYAINDNYFGSDKATAALQFETIVREVKQALPDCDIVVVLTTDYNKMATTIAGDFFPQAEGHYEIAAAYNLPVMNIGLGLAKGIEEVEGSNWWTGGVSGDIWTKYFCDSVHPYSTGHAMYYACVEEFLENSFLYTDYTGMSSSRVQLPAVQSDNLLDGNRHSYMGAAMQDKFVSGTSATYSTGTFVSGTSQAARDGHYDIAADGSITFSFTGTEVALWTNYSDTSGSYTYSIDDGTEQTVAGKAHMPTVFATGLSAGEHTITVRVTDGTAFKIAGLFERDATQQTVQGATYTYADANTLTATVPAGNYTVAFAATVGELPVPAVPVGYRFVGYSDADGAVYADSTQLTPGMELYVATKKTEALTIYVDSVLGSDDTADGTNSATPFATINAAIAELNTKTGTGKVIKVINTADLPATMEASEDEIHITSDNAEATLNMTSNVKLNGDLRIGGIKSSLTNAGNRFEAGGYKLTLDEDFYWSATGMYWPGYFGGITNTNVGKNTLVMNGGYLYQMFTGSYYNTTNVTADGFDLVMNGGQIYTFRIGANGWNAQTGTVTTYTDNVNITVNGGQIRTNIAVVNKDDGTEVRSVAFAEGAALQIIFNNGMGEGILVGQIKDMTKEFEADYYYRLNCTNQPGSTLEITDTTGTYKVNGDLVAVASQNGVVKAMSVDGVLTVPAAGVYDVTWQLDPTPLNTFVNISTGEDTNNGLSADAPFKTVHAAVEAIQASNHQSGTVTIIGKANYQYSAEKDWRKLPAHDKMVTIYGQDPASDGFTGCTIQANGPLTLANIKLYNCGFKSNGYEFNIGENVTTTGYPYVYAHAGTYATSNSGVDVATMASGEIATYQLGPNASWNNEISTGGVLYTQTGGGVEKIQFGSEAWNNGNGEFKNVVFNGDVNIVLNGGQLGGLVVMNPSDEFTYTVNRDTVLNGAVQVIVNKQAVFINQDTIDAVRAKTDKVWLINARNNGGYILETTATAGTFKLSAATVAAGVTAYATNAAGDIIESVNGELTLPAGDWTVEFENAEDRAYTNTGDVVKFYKDTMVSDFSSIPHEEKANAFFIGWKLQGTDEYAQVGEFSAGVVFEAMYATYTATDFTINGMQIREPAQGTTGKTDLRYVLTITDTIKASSAISNVEYGGVALPNAMLTVDLVSEKLSYSAGSYPTAADVKIDGQYWYKGKIQSPIKKAVTNANAEGKFGLVLTNIPVAKYDARYVVRGYVTYTDANGAVQTIYTAERSESLISTASKYAEDDTMADLITQGKDALIAKYNVTKTPVTLDSRNTTYVIDANGVITNKNTGKVIKTVNKLTGHNIIEHEVTIEGVGDTSGKVVQITDTHFNAFDEQDYAEGHPSVLESAANNRMCNFNFSFSNGMTIIQNFQAAMEYASAWGDQTVITGDVVDGLARGSLQLLKRHISIAYPDALVVNGNHDLERKWGVSPATPDAASEQSCRDVVQEYLNNDIEYTSKVVGNGVMVIQMDNGIGNLRESVMLEPLTADLATARANGYTVLIFTHIPLSTGKTEDAALIQLRGADTKGTANYQNGTSDKAGTKVYDLIAESADVVKGIFNGHTHADYYTEIPATLGEGGAATVIPQYTIDGSYYTSYAQMLKITVQ